MKLSDIELILILIEKGVDVARIITENLKNTYDRNDNILIDDIKRLEITGINYKDEV